MALDPWVLRRRLLIAVGVVSAFGLAIELAHAFASSSVVEALLPKLSLSYEGNLPTWFSSCLLLMCSIAAGVIASAHPPGHRHWWGMCLVAGWMSLDEAAELHEHLSGLFTTHGVLYFDWVIPAAAIVLALAVLYIPFIRVLDRDTRRGLVIAATVYVTGALLMELPLGWITEHWGMETVRYALVDWVEETMEMIGATLAFVVLVDHHLRHRQRSQRA